jgi:acetyltransferase-like isoleucine patch superfamily enzyme
MATPLIPHARIPFGHMLAFGWMPSPLKVWAYRTFLHYRIGRHVSIGPGAAVVGDDVEIADGVSIGLLAVVQGRRIAIGRHSKIGTMSYVSCERIEIGEDAWIAEQVYVGGPQLPESLFQLGSRTIVLQQANINATKPVIIGDDTGIGGHCLIFTHGAWLNVLDGYPADYKPVTIGKSVWLPWRVFVMPGTTIGDGSVIGANSLVSGTIPPCSLALGTPAKVVRQAPDWPKVPGPAQQAELVATMVAEFDRFATYKGVTVREEPPRRVYSRGAARYRLLWLHAGSDAAESAQADTGDTVLAEVPLDDAIRATLRERGVYWLDLAGRMRSCEGSPLTEELALFIRRYGIRLPRD